MQKNPGENFSTVEVDPVTANTSSKCLSGLSPNLGGMRVQRLIWK